MMTSNIAFLPWPLSQPCISVPFFDLDSYRRVNLNSNPSCFVSGGDMPFHDLCTLRFFYNLGVQHSRNILARQQQEQYSRQVLEYAVQQQLSADQQQHLQFTTTVASNLPTTCITSTQSHYTPPAVVTTQSQCSDIHQQQFLDPSYYNRTTTEPCDHHESTPMTTRPHPFHLLTAAENLYLATGVDPKVCHLHDSIAEQRSATNREPELLAKAARAASAMIQTRTATGESALLPNMISYLNEFIQSAKRKLEHRGMLLKTDGNPLNYSARPIDPIFKAARQQLRQQELMSEEMTPTHKKSSNPTITSHRHRRRHHSSSSSSSSISLTTSPTITTTTTTSTSSSTTTFANFQNLMSATIRRTLLRDDDDRPRSKRLRPSSSLDGRQKISSQLDET